MEKKKITVTDIAKEANVSAATVSRVLNHRYQVKDSTIRKVESAMMTLGYPVVAKSDPLPSGLKLIVLNIPLFGNSFYHLIIRGAQMSAKAHGYQILVHETQLNKETVDNFCSLLSHVKAEGTILLSPSDKDVLDRIDSITPLVQCCEYTEGAGYPYITIDDFTAAETATDHLIRCNRDKIAFINGPLIYKYAVQRQSGFLCSLEKAGISIPKGWIIHLPEIDFEMAFTSACRLLNARDRPNAFFVVSDILAAAVIRATIRFGLSVPNDIMVVGFDNIEISQMTTPSITTLKQPSFQQGYSACELLIDSIEHRKISPKPLVLEAELIVRESTLTIL